jgi:hypothetical protein
MDVQPAAPHHRSDMVAPNRPSFDRTNAQATTAMAATNDSEALDDHVKEKGKEKVEQKKKELVFIGGKELVDLDDYKVFNKRL